ncbi:MAG: hypothetical protein J2P37_30305 [Ktedonobacteraceae bacterium]|nr:hypothetical protein [Ktedonobacteraceae bacterium]
MEVSVIPQTATLRLEMLLELLQTHQQTCELHAEASQFLEDGGQPRQVKVTMLLLVERGQLRTCQICDRQSGEVLLTGSQALARCRQWGTLAWQVWPAAALATVPLPRANRPEEGLHGAFSPTAVAWGHWRDRPPPRWVHRPSQEQLAMLPHRQRQVLISVNGQRSFTDLSQLLQCAPEQLTTLLDELEARGLITSTEHRSSNEKPAWVSPAPRFRLNGTR